MKNRSKQRRDPRAERYRQKKRADFLKYLRQNTWLLLVAVLVLIALVLFICVLAGSSPDVVQPPKQQSAGQIRGLEEGGLDGGFMVWHAACSLQKLETFKPAFDVPGAAEE